MTVRTGTRPRRVICGFGMTSFGMHVEVKFCVLADLLGVVSTFVTLMESS
jgi:hypothetical protein